MATSRKDLEELHKLIAKSFKTRIEADVEDGIPTDAATLSAAVKFLKDNAVTADPADQDDLSELRDRMTEQAARRTKRVGNVLDLVKNDLKEAHG
jgi:hypothetical protein